MKDEEVRVVREELGMPEEEEKVHGCEGVARE